MIRPVDAVRAGLGLAALVAPGRLLTGAGSSDSARLRAVVRVLGARYVAQAALGTARPGRTVWRLDAAVDGLHATSMLVAARLFPQHRRAALTSALAAATFAGADLRDAEVGP